MVRSITSISKPYPDGQRVTAIAVEYEKDFSAQELPADVFAVPGRTVTRVYTSGTKEADKTAEDGRYIIIEMDPRDGMASTLTDKDGRHISMPQPPRQPRPQGAQGGPQGGHGGPPTITLPDGRVFKGPAGLVSVRNDIHIPLRQEKDLKAGDGSVIPAWDAEMITDSEINEWSDLFEVREFEGYKYNIFVPEDYDPSVKYPLLMFIHDAGTTGESPRVTLEQGLGATIFASPEEQKKHPCIIVAPQHSAYYPIANDMYWCFDDEHKLKRILDKVQEEYSIDTDRIYTTGQSMGFMTSVQLLLDYPDYFAAALLPAGHWDIEKTATLWDRNIWFFLCEDDRGAKRLIDNLPQAIENIGGHAGVYVWDANQPTAELGRLVESVKNDGNSCHITVFPHGTISRADQPDRTDGGGHNGTWHLVYQIEAARDWLFEQKK